MTKYEILQEFKSELKEIASQIKEKKKLRKSSSTGYVMGLDSLRCDFRHKHIAYCQLRGRERDQIEKPGKYNKPNESRIDKIMAEKLALYVEEVLEEQQAAVG